MDEKAVHESLLLYEEENPFYHFKGQLMKLKKFILDKVTQNGCSSKTTSSVERLSPDSIDSGFSSNTLSLSSRASNAQQVVEMKIGEAFARTFSTDPNHNGRIAFLKRESESQGMQSSANSISNQVNGDCKKMNSAMKSSSTPSLSSSTTALFESRFLYCKWQKCGKCFECANDLYDHVKKCHIELLKPSKNVSIADRLRSPAKPRVKNFQCHWSKCSMQLSRGDSQKQYTWLEEHFATRHAGKAQPYRCLMNGCKMRFASKRALDDHLRTGHRKTKVKKVRAKEVKVSPFEWTPLPYYEPDHNEDFLDRATTDWLYMRLKKYEETENACLVPNPPKTPRGGAKYRKQRRIMTYSICSLPNRIR